MRIQGAQLRGFLAGMGDTPVCECITAPCDCAGQPAPITLNQAGDIFKWVAIGLGVLFILSAMRKH